MASFLERLRAALSYRYDVDREIASGGMGTVFLGRHRPLDMPVAIKALRDDVYSYTALTEERFIREAKTLALFSHPHIVPVHDADKRDGIPFYVMTYLAGETLEDRLVRGPLPGADAARLGAELLDALGAAHKRDVIHRDVKPSNIMFQDERAMLVDFGIARRVTADPVTGQGDRPGTLDWMSPEQLAGAELTPRSDLYSAAMVLYKAFSGAMWSVTAAPHKADWSGVPRRVRPVLERALQFDAADRWPDAAAFRAALERAIGPRPISGWIAAALVVVAAGVVIRILIGPPSPRPKLPVFDVVIAPFTTSGTSDLALGREVSRFTTLALQFPRLRVVDSRAAFSCWDAARAARSLESRSRCRLGAHYVVEGTVSGHGDSVDVDLTLFDRGDEVVPIRDVAGLAAVPELTSAVATTVLQGLVKQDSTLGPVDTVTIAFCGRSVDALAALSQGEEAFQRDDWIEADQDYQRALTLDPTCALAAWRLSIVRSWRRMPVGVDLRHLYDRQRGALPPGVRSLLAAQLAPSGPERIAAYRTAVKAYPGDSYGWLLFGNELWSRGTLAGVGLLAADSALQRAVLLDRSARVYDHIAWLNIRLGNRAAARAALDSIPPGPRGDVDLPRLLRLGYYLRFAPDSAQGAASSSDTILSDIAKAVRFGLTVDVPDGQLLFGEQLAAASGITTDQRADGHEAEGVALIMMGRNGAALAQFDSAAALRGPAARIEPAEWRLLLHGFGLLAPADSGVALARRVLQGLSADPALGRRATWDLAVSAYAARDTIPGARMVRAFQPRDPQDSLALRALLVLQMAARGRLAEAVDSARPLGWTDADHLRRYPFLRAVMHLHEGAWLVQLGDTAGADSALLWYDNADAAQWPIGPAQAGDVDWSLAAWARVLRARLDPAGRACDAKRAAELWAGADASYQALVAEARTRGQACKS